MEIDRPKYRQNCIIRFCPIAIIVDTKEHDDIRNIKMWCTEDHRHIARMIEGDIIVGHNNDRIGSIECVSSKYFRPNAEK